MPVFTRNIRIFNPRNGRAREMTAVIDTGSDLCQIPETLAADLDIIVSGYVDTRIASGEIMYEPTGNIGVEFDQYSIYTTTSIGPEDAPVILGAIALAQMGLGVDPVEERLIPRILYLLMTTPASGGPTI